MTTKWLSMVALFLFILLASLPVVGNAAQLEEISNQRFSHSFSPVNQTTSCAAQLPTIQWLGEGQSEYTLPDGYQQFIIKRLHPFRFELEAGQPSGGGQTVYQAKRNERVWACAGNCGLPAVYHAAYEVGSFEASWRLNLVVIDDDPDDRRNWWAADDPATPYLVVEDQQFVEYLSFDAPFAATWYYYAQDSIGIAATCVEQIKPTPTPVDTATSTPIDTPTNTPTETPSLTATPTETPTSTAIVLDTPTSTPPPTLIPTDTPTASATPIDTPTATVTATATATSTLEPTPTPPQAVLPPTDLDPEDEPTQPNGSRVYLPLINR